MHWVLPHEMTLAYPLIAAVDWRLFFYQQYQTWKIPLQFMLVFVAVSWFYFKIQGTYVAQLLKGVAVILLFYLIAGIFNLTIISGILQAILQISIIGFIILFQPELRRLLVYLGQPDLLGRTTFQAGSKEKQAAVMIHELVESIRLLSKTKTGALIVLESPNGLGGTYLEAGTKLDARLSTELLLTLFHPNTPLHDGAVLINVNSRIVAAGVLLPLSENPNLSWKYGTRHRAAIGLSEISDCHCLVVSEESGSISSAYAGNIEKINTVDELREHLERLFGLSESHNKANQRRMSIAELFSSDLLHRFFSKQAASFEKSGASSHTETKREKIGS